MPRVVVWEQSGVYEAVNEGFEGGHVVVEVAAAAVWESDPRHESRSHEGWAVGRAGHHAGLHAQCPNPRGQRASVGAAVEREHVCLGQIEGADLPQGRDSRIIHHILLLPAGKGRR